MGIKSGSNYISRMYKGNFRIKEVYQGSNLVFSFDMGNISRWRNSNSVIPNKILLYNYMGNDLLWNSILYVPRVVGKSVINDWYDDSTSGITDDNRNTPFYNNQDIKRVDLQRVPFRNNSMFNAFYRCRNLNYIVNINNNVTNMQGSFRSCSNLNQNIQIPVSVSDIDIAFAYCNMLNQNIQIPAGITSMRSTFYSCSNLNQNIRIPSSVTSMFSTFKFCINLRQNIQIPNSVTNMNSTFEYCGVTSGKITVYSADVKDATNCLAAGPSEISIPSRYINNAVTNTWKALNTAGWKITNNGTENNSVRGWDLIGGDWNDYKGNGTHWILYKWNGKMSAERMGVPYITNVQVPETITTYDTFPVALDDTCFTSNNIMTNLDIGTSIPYVSNSMYRAFFGCTSLIDIKGVINSSVTNMYQTCYNDVYLKHFDAILPKQAAMMRATFQLCPNLTTVSPLPVETTTLLDCFALSGKVIGNLQVPVIPKNVITLQRCLSNRLEDVGNMYILSPNVSTIAGMRTGVPTTFKKSYYIYYKYSNNDDTLTYNSFKKDLNYMGTSGNSAGTSPLYNSVNNSYVYNLSEVYDSLWEHTYISNTTSTLDRYIGNDKHVAVFANFPDRSINSFKLNCFTDCSSIVSLALYNTPINVNSNYSGSCANLFRNCTNLRVVQGLSLDRVITKGGLTFDNVTLDRAFENCYNLRVMSAIPNTVVGMTYTFANCTNFNYNIQLGNEVTNFKGTFYNCPSLDQNIKIPNKAQDVSEMFSGCLNLNKNIQIPSSVENMRNTFYSCAKLGGRIEIFSTNVVDATDCFVGATNKKEVHIINFYANGMRTATFNSFVSAGYLYNNGLSTGKNNTTFYGLMI